MKIPPVDLQAEFKELETEINSRVNRVLKSGHFVLGEEVREFEAHFAREMEAKYCVSVASGSDALLLGLMALGIGSGDEVITTPFTFIATATAVDRLGAKPIFIDIDPDTLNIDPELIEKAITKQTRAILPVHLYGLPCEMHKIMAIAKKHGLRVLEDCAQSAGAKLSGKSMGTFGELGAFSFYPTKTLGAYGDGGAILTDSPELEKVLRSLRDHGAGDKKYYHERIGVNSRLDEIQAAILNVKLKRLAAWNEKRRELAAQYDGLFAKAKLSQVKIPKRPASVKAVYHQYAIYVEQRDALLNHLKESGISANVYYPLPLHLQTCFHSLSYQKGSMPYAEAAAQTVLNLPIYPQLGQTEQEFVVFTISRFFGTPQSR